MDRGDLQKLAQIRIQEARVLLQNNLYAGSYYLAGYSIECGFKACIAKQIQQHESPNKKFILDSYTHDLDKLLNVSGLKTELHKASQDNPDFDLNWSIIKDWSVNTRCEHTVSQQRASDLLEAIAHNENGLLKWIQDRW